MCVIKMSIVSQRRDVAARFSRFARAVSAGLAVRDAARAVGLNNEVIHPEGLTIIRGHKSRPLSFRLGAIFGRVHRKALYPSGWILGCEIYLASIWIAGLEYDRFVNLLKLRLDRLDCCLVKW